MAEPSGDRQQQQVRSPNGRYMHHSEILGVGASKTVYKAFDVEKGLNVAWNDLNLNVRQGARGDQSKAMVAKEVQLLKQLDHPNVLKTMDAWVHDDTLTFITELMPGGTLRQLIKKIGAQQRISLKAVRGWATQILDALVYLHSKGIVHRDLKCDNLFVDSGSGKITLGDLGLAKVLDESEDDTVGTFVGTPTHMAPEFFDEDGGPYDEKIDVWAFGMTLIEIVARQFPYSELQNKGQIFNKVANRELPETQIAMLPPSVKALVMRCLVDCAQRPSAAELLQDPFFIGGPTALTSSVDGEEEEEAHLDTESVHTTEERADKSSSSGSMSPTSLTPRSSSPEGSPTDPPQRSVSLADMNAVLEFEFVLHHHDTTDRISFEFHALKDDARTDAAQLVEALGLDVAPEGIAIEIQKEVDWFKEHRFDANYRHGVDNVVVVEIFANADEVLEAPTRADLHESEFLHASHPSSPENHESVGPLANEPSKSPFNKLWEGKLKGYQVRRAADTPVKVQMLGTTHSPRKKHSREFSLSNYNNMVDKMLNQFVGSEASAEDPAPPSSAPAAIPTPNARKRLSLSREAQARAIPSSSDSSSAAGASAVHDENIPNMSSSMPSRYQPDMTTMMLLMDDDTEEEQVQQQQQQQVM